MPTESNELAFSAVFLNRNPLTNDKINQLAQWGKKCKDLGLVQEADGNLSFRSTLGFIISGTGVALEAITKETVAEVTGVVFGMAGTSAYVKGPVTPSRESLLHQAIYDEFEDINAIFHVHDKVVMEKAARLGIPVTETEQVAGSAELAKEAVKLLKFNKDVKYIVLKNRGVIALGATMDEAGKLLEDMRTKTKAK
jgi:ribulose-5-phosphate 4-epimerase/fuculose-1-phosphate aldolase